MTAEFYVMLLVAIVAAGTAFAFYLQYSALAAADSKRKADAEEAHAKAEKAKKELDSSKGELDRRRQEAADLRDKLNELRQKQHKRSEDQKRKASSGDLASDLENARRDFEAAQAQADVLSREAKGMEEEISRLREANKKLDEAYRAAQSATRNVATAAVAAQDANVATAAATAVATQHAQVFAAPARSDVEWTAKLDALNVQLGETRRRLLTAEDETKKARAKGSAGLRQAQLTKGELDLFREKLVWSEKRVVELERLLFDNKIALPNRDSAPSPRALELAPGILARESANTGGEGVVAESAEYVPEGPASAEAAPATEAAAPAASAEAPVESTESTGPQAVPPIRRQRAEAEAPKTE